jgi:hypothetical protein
MEPSDYDEITLCNTLLFQRYGTTGGIKEMGSHNRSANGHSVTAALCVTPLMLARSYSYLVNFSETCSTYPKHKSFIWSYTVCGDNDSGTCASLHNLCSCFSVVHMLDLSKHQKKICTNFQKVYITYPQTY